MKIKVYGLCNVLYDSFYIKGLYCYFNKHKVFFDMDSFPNFGQNVFAVIIEKENYIKRIIIDSRDSNELNFEQLTWCDVYAKVNYNSKFIPKQFNDKVIPIGPSFGIKIWNYLETFYLASSNFIRFYSQIRNKRDFLANYYRQLKRLPLEHYKNDVKNKENYIFFISSIWKRENQTNLNRLNFIKACKNNINFQFEGGFAPRSNKDNLGFEDYVVNRRYSLNEYIYKTKKSIIAFNTPAVLSCHGWKLGEFLALGKAIISTEHYNEMPIPLINCEHVYYVEGITSIEEGISRISSDTDFRKKLEKNASKYFQDYLMPAIIIQKIMEK